LSSQTGGRITADNIIYNSRNVHLLISHPCSGTIDRLLQTTLLKIQQDCEANNNRLTTKYTGEIRQRTSRGALLSEESSRSRAELAEKKNTLAKAEQGKQSWFSRGPTFSLQRLKEKQSLCYL
jgi:uncharacterized small protein (DUF1192 family)